jgi:hypothetical protein
MFKGHPWEGETFGPIEYYWYLRRGYVMNILFDLDLKPFLVFCKKEGISTNQLMMKISARLSQKYLPQYVVALNRKAYPARYPAGYVRRMHPDRDMLEWIGIREKEDHFAERGVRDDIQPAMLFLMTRLPRVALWLGRWLFARKEVKDQYALMVSRNPLRSLGEQVIFHGTHYRTFVMAIPFGEKVKACFGAPHAFGNIDCYEEFLNEYKKAVEHPETLPRELVEKKYKTKPLPSNSR